MFGRKKSDRRTDAEKQRRTAEKQAKKAGRKAKYGQDPEAASTQAWITGVCHG